MPERRVVVMPISPPRRLLAPLRWRSFKLGPDYQVWDQVMAPVRALLADGWRMVQVRIDWGASFPLTPGRREQAARELTECHGACEIAMMAGSPGRGTTTVEMEREVTDA